ncbi:hypothetical protein C1646_681890 [Rhizophagus diaphanus]|nr:hypothetical protein C1646_681890 [Rhizophagus diaphanus] [Rhizophagus sp. MUCL 43196]
MIRGWVYELLDLIKLTKDQVEKRVLTRIIIKDGKEELVKQEVMVLICLECDDLIIKVTEWSKEKNDQILKEFKEELSRHILESHNILKERFENIKEKLKKNYYERIKKDTDCIEKAMCLRSIMINMMKQYGIWDRIDDERIILEKRKMNNEEKKKYGWFDSENPFEVETCIIELEEIIPKGNILEMMDEIE